MSALRHLPPVIFVLLLAPSARASSPACPANWDRQGCESLLADPLNPPRALEHYTRESQFYQVHAQTDVPSDLKWEDGSELEPFSDPQAQKGGTLILPLDTAPTSFRTDGESAMAGRLGWFYWDVVNMPFTKLHANSRKRIPGLASRWAVSADHRSVFFEINSEAEYQPSWIRENSILGTPEQKFPREPIKTGNVFYGFYLIKNDILDPWLHNLVETYFDSVHIYSNRIVEIRFKKPNFTALADASQLVAAQPRLFYGPLAGTASERYREVYQWSFPASAGPYAMPSDRDFSIGHSVTLRRVKNWWGSQNKFNRNRYNPDTIIFKVSRMEIKNLETVGLKDSISFLKFDASDYYQKIERNPSLLERIDRGELQFFEFSPNVPLPRKGIYINVKNEKLKDPNLRRGLVLSFNYEAVNSVLFQGVGARLNALVGGYGNYDSPTIKAPKFDPNEASKIFKSLGYQRNADGIFEHPQKGLLSFVLTTYDQWGFATECALLKEGALKAGVLLHCEVLEKTLASTKTILRQHELSLIKISGGDSEIPVYSHVTSEQAAQARSGNYSNISDPTLDNLINRYNLEMNKETLQNLSRQIIERHASWNAFVPGVNDQRYFIVAGKSFHLPDTDTSFFDDPFKSNTFWIDSSSE